MMNVLKSMSLNAVAKDLMLTYTIEHHYENTTDKPVEISYSFPLKSTAVITEFEATVGGVTRKAKAFPKKKAQVQYEESLDKGDAPVMLEVSGGIASTSLGNLKPQEKATVRISIAEMLEVKQGTVKITIPTVIADRYEMVWGAAPRNEKRIRSNLFAHYECKGKIVLSGFLAKGRVSSPTHAISLASIGSGDFEVLLPENAALDRDITISIDDVAGEGLLVSRDSEGWAAIASFSPKAEVANKPIALSILVDCSGSMSGSSIELTKKALRRFAQSLKRKDTVTYTRFGSDVRHDIQEPMACTVRNIRDVYLPCVAETEADMGGTELVEALEAVINSEGVESRDILLITDGEVWGEDALFNVVKKCSCRLFIIGIGLAPEEANLSHCAKATRGAYEAVHDESEIEKAIARMLTRMRAEETVAPTIDWGRIKPDYQSKLPLSIFSGDSVTVYAHFSEKPDENPVLSWFHNTNLMRADLHSKVSKEENSVAKLVANSRMMEAKDEKTQEKIGCEYNLVGPATNLLLTIERAKGEAVEEIPELVVVSQMVKAGAAQLMHEFRMLPIFECSNIIRECDPIELGSPSQNNEKVVELVHTFLLTGKGYRDIFEESELIEILKDIFTQLKNLEAEDFLKELAKILYEILLGDSAKEARAIRKALRDAGFEKES